MESKLKKLKLLDKGNTMIIRKDLILSIIILVVLILSTVNLSAENFRVTKPKVWEKATVEEAIKELYGSNKFVEGKITLEILNPCLDIWSCKVGIKSNADLETLAIFQDVNPKPTVAIFTIHDDTVIDYSVDINTQRLYENTLMDKEVNIIVIGKGRDGRLYKAVKKTTVVFSNP